MCLLQKYKELVSLYKELVIITFKKLSTLSVHKWVTNLSLRWSVSHCVLSDILPCTICAQMELFKVHTVLNLHIFHLFTTE